MKILSALPTLEGVRGLRPETEGLFPVLELFRFLDVVLVAEPEEDVLFVIDKEVTDGIIPTPS